MSTAFYDISMLTPDGHFGIDIPVREMSGPYRYKFLTLCGCSGIGKRGIKKRMSVLNYATERTARREYFSIQLAALDTVVGDTIFESRCGRE